MQGRMKSSAKQKRVSVKRGRPTRKRREDRKKFEGKGKNKQGERRKKKQDERKRSVSDSFKSNDKQKSAEIRSFDEGKTFQGFIQFADFHIILATCSRSHGAAPEPPPGNDFW